MVNSNKFTLAWYVDDNKLSHVVTKVVDEILKILKRKLGGYTIQQGKKFILLGKIVTIIKV